MIVELIVICSGEAKIAKIVCVECYSTEIGKAHKVRFLRQSADRASEAASHMLSLEGVSSNACGNLGIFITRSLHHYRYFLGVLNSTVVAGTGNFNYTTITQEPIPSGASNSFV